MTQYRARVDEMRDEIRERLGDDHDPGEALLYARCSAAFEQSVNKFDVPPENALGVMTAALSEATDQSGFEFVDVLDTAREHHTDVGEVSEA